MKKALLIAALMLAAGSAVAHGEGHSGGHEFTGVGREAIHVDRSRPEWHDNRYHSGYCDAYYRNFLGVCTGSTPLTCCF